MTALVWDKIGERVYETGISKGVFYDDTSAGVAWNGLTAVEENASKTVDPLYFDGLRYENLETLGDFSGILRALTYPDEFLPYEGLLEDQSGFFITDQPCGKFSLCYRTEIGNDVEGLGHGYKLHILYNLTATPAQKSHQTMGLDTQPIEFEWSIIGIPEDIEHFRPTAHIILDSRKMDPWLLRDIEDILYGDEDSDPQLPSLKSLVSFIRKWDRFIITDHGDGTWTADSVVEGQIIMLDDTTFEIDTDTAVYLDPETYEISSSDKNEEDIWPL